MKVSYTGMNFLGPHSKIEIVMTREEAERIMEGKGFMLEQLGVKLVIRGENGDKSPEE